MAAWNAERAGGNMWEADCYDWKSLDAYRDAGRVPQLLKTILQSDDEAEWGAALSYLESCGSDLGVPCSVTPALVSCLGAVVLRVSDKKRSAVLSLLEELTCGRGAEQYSDAQKKWHREAAYELVLGLKLWVDIMETSSVEDAGQCVDLLAYCAEHVPAMGGRVRMYLKLCEARYPQLGDEIRAVTEYLVPHED